MFKYVLFSKENQIVGEMPVDAPTVEFHTSVSLSHVVLYCGKQPICELNVTTMPDQVSASETLTVNFGDELPIGYEIWSMALRMHQQRVYELVTLIQQARDIIGGQKARKPVHNFYPQTPTPQQQVVQDEEQQPFRGWGGGRLVQRIVDRFVGRVQVP